MKVWIQSGKGREEVASFAEALTRTPEPSKMGLGPRIEDEACVELASPTCLRGVREGEWGLTDAGVYALRFESAAHVLAELDTPEIADWLKATEREAKHQRARWGLEHDAGKTSAEWFWLLGHLASKGMLAAATGDIEKAKHHTISSAAVLYNWHAALSGEHTRMRPGIAPPVERVCARCRKPYEAHVIETEPPQHADCVGFVAEGAGS
jgi:hypothetical protein